MGEAKIPIINVNVPEPWHSVIAALTARAEAAEIDWEENNALAAAKVCLEAENAALTARAEAAERVNAYVGDGGNALAFALENAEFRHQLATLRTQLQQAEQDREEAHAMVRETARLRDQDQTIAANMIGRKDDEIRGLNKELDALKLELKKAIGQRDTLRAEMNAEEKS
jgi:hypothetical protein